MMLLPRKHLSLSSLDLAAPQDDLPQSRFYESQVKILELDSRLGPASSVLIARNESKGSLFAIERHANGLFVLCKLGQWVEVSELARHSTVVCEERVFRTQPRQAPKTDSSLASTTPQIRKNEKVKRNAIEAIQSLVKKRARSQSIVQPTDATIEDGPAETRPSLEECSTPAAPPHASHEIQAPVVVAEAVSTPQQTAEALFDNIRTHYSEALYKSKVWRPLLLHLLRKFFC
jgi:DNA replication regulator SLD3